MKRTLTSIFAVVLTLSMVLSLTACGGNGEKKEDATEAVTEVVTEAPVTDVELCAEYAVEKLKDILKNPSSLIVNELHAVQDEDGYIFEIDYTAENGFGGSNRDNFYIIVSKKDNGFATRSLGSSNYADDTSQMYTEQLYNQTAVSGYYDFDTTTFRLK